MLVHGWKLLIFSKPEFFPPDRNNGSYLKGEELISGFNTVSLLEPIIGGAFAIVILHFSLRRLTGSAEKASQYPGILSFRGSASNEIFFLISACICMCALHVCARVKFQRVSCILASCST